MFDGTFVTSIYKPLKGIGKNLVLVDVPADLQERSGMTFGDVTIKDTTLKGWIYDDAKLSNYSLIYAMNDLGETNYYQYESTGNTLQLYPEGLVVSQSEYDAVVKENVKITQEKDNMSMYFYIACGVAVVSFVFAIVGLVNANRYKNRLLTRKSGNEEVISEETIEVIEEPTDVINENEEVKVD